MDSFNKQYYRGRDFKCVRERKPQGNCVKVYPKARLLAHIVGNEFPPPSREDHYVSISREDHYASMEQYKISPYENEQKAYTHAYGWIAILTNAVYNRNG